MGKKLDGRSDLFSLGVTLYKLASSKDSLVLLAIVALVIGDRLVGLRKLADF